MDKEEFLKKGNKVLGKAKDFEKELSDWFDYYDELDCDKEIEVLCETDQAFSKLSDELNKVVKKLNQML